MDIKPITLHHLYGKHTLIRLPSLIGSYDVAYCECGLFFCTCDGPGAWELVDGISKYSDWNNILRHAGKRVRALKRAYDNALLQARNDKYDINPTHGGTLWLDALTRKHEDKP